ncbi:MAG TPA: hypothetical protein VGI57_11200 [Usitatibacter sp.]|jgi:hypothetical protein
MVAPAAASRFGVINNNPKEIAMTPAALARITRIRRPASLPILEIDDDGVPVFQTSFDGRRWSEEGDEPNGVALGDWPSEFED